MRRLMLLFLVLPCLVACAPADSESSSANGSPAAIDQAAAQSLSQYDGQVDPLIERMTLEEKVGQMTQADMSFIKDEADVGKYFLGSVLSGGGSDPAAGNEAEQWRDMVEGYQEQARATRLGIPLLYGVDAVHGHNNVVGAVVFPHNIGLGATRDAGLVKEIHRVTALEVRATAINWNFSPCVAVARDIRWGRTYESYSEDTALVAELGEAALLGLQGAGLKDPLSVLACAKHYLADGGTQFGTGTPKDSVPDSVFAESGRKEEDVERWPLDRGDTQMDEATLRALHMPGYLKALDAGVATIMPSFSSWNGEKVSGHKYLLTDVLKTELGFEGFLISDWSAIDDLPGDFTSDIAQSINAGMDMVMVPDRYKLFFETLKRLVEEGTVPMTRIDDAVRRILRVKAAMGLLDENYSHQADRSLLAHVGSEPHRDLARQAVRKSLVLLKNEGSTLPLSREIKRIHVVGKNADDLGNQSGGWTIQWQGASGPITRGTTVLEAVRAAAGPGTEVTFSLDGSGAGGADVVLAVIGETPYSEMMGDRVDLGLDEADQRVVAQAAAAGVPVVTVLISGRPMILGETLEQSAAVVAAWLPGTEGTGVADVLFGDAQPTGKLAFSWPRSIEQVPINHGDEGYDPLFPFGFGLQY